MEPSPPLQAWRAPALQSDFRVREHSPGPERKGVGGFPRTAGAVGLRDTWNALSELAVLRVDFNSSMCRQWTVVLCQFACRLISL